jgi:O-antigen/teichoic acid export membrane protein
MLALYTNIPGLLLAGPMIAQFGFHGMALVYCGGGLVLTVWIAARWAAHLWNREAVANRR